MFQTLLLTSVVFWTSLIWSRDVYAANGPDDRYIIEIPSPNLTLPEVSCSILRMTIPTIEGSLVHSEYRLRVYISTLSLGIEFHPLVLLVRYT